MHDELDLEPSQIRFKAGEGLAGHNGLKDSLPRIGECLRGKNRFGHVITS